MSTGEWVLIAVATAGMLLTLGLIVSGTIRARWPFGHVNRFEAFGKQPGEDSSAQARRGVKIILGLVLTLVGVWAFADAVMGGVIDQHALVRTPMLRIIYGATGVLLAVIAMALSGRLSSRSWPRE